MPPRRTAVKPRPAVEGGKPVRREPLAFFRPVVGEAEETAVRKVLRSGWITTGPTAHAFEAALAKRLGAKHLALVSSATIGLSLALEALGVGPGDEVITSPITFVATANVIMHRGARVRFVDVDPETLTLDPAAARRAVNAKTRAILPVHLAGHPADLDPLLRLARTHRLAVIEDAAHAFGARYKGQPIGLWGDATVFSFHAVKNLTSAEGGAVTVKDPEVLARIRRLANHGLDADAWQRFRERRWGYVMPEPGYKANLSDLHAAVGLAQLARFNAFQKRRRAISAAYHRAFVDNPALNVPTQARWTEHAWHVYILRLRPERVKIHRDRFLEALAAEGILGNVHYFPVHLQPYYRKTYGYAPGDLPVAEAASRATVTLPLYPAMTDTDVRDVVAAVDKLTAYYGR